MAHRRIVVTGLGIISPVGIGLTAVMARSSNTDRLSPPLMFAFREAHRERDARVVVDLRVTQLVNGARGIHARLAHDALR